MKIAFVNPRYYEENYRYKVNKLSPPLGMALLAKMLQLNNHEVQIYDLEAMELTIEDKLDSISDFSPRIIGVFGTSPINKFQKQTIKVIRDKFPNSIIIVGGPHATLFPDDFFSDSSNVDYVFRGESEFAIVKFVQQIEKYSSVTIPDKIEGIVYNNNGQIYKHAVIPKTKDLNLLPIPAYDLLPLEKYFETGSTEKVITMMTSRGCPHSCIYCSDPVLYGHKYRSRSAEKVVEEMTYLRNEHGIDHIVFYDANFNHDKERIKNICRIIIDENLNMTWRARIRADNLDRESLELMKRAGCTELSVGVESGSEKILKNLNKKATKDQIRDAFRLLKEFDIWIVGYFMFGIPGETPLEAEQTIQFAIELDPDWALFSSATPLPGTKFMEMCEESNWIISNDLNNYKANFASPVVSYVNYTNKQIENSINTAYSRFYLRKEWIINRLKKAKSNAQIINIINSYKFYNDKKI